MEGVRDDPEMEGKNLKRCALNLEKYMLQWLHDARFQTSTFSLLVLKKVMMSLFFHYFVQH